MRAYLELSETGKSTHKFYEVETRGTLLRIRYGRIGADGNISEKSFRSPAEATKAAQKKIGEKKAKGYVESRKGARKKKTGARSAEATRNPPKGVRLLKEISKGDDYRRVYEIPGLATFGHKFFELWYRHFYSRRPSPERVKKEREALKRFIVVSEEGRWDESYEAKLHWLVKNWDKLVPRIRKATFGFYREQYEDIRQFFDEKDADQIVPPPKNAAVIDDLFRMSTIYLSDASNCMGLSGGCTWDEEHAWGCMLSRTKVLEVGHASDGFGPSVFG